MSADPAIPTVHSVAELRTQIVGMEKEVPLLASSHETTTGHWWTSTFRSETEHNRSQLGG
jgi:hypothetical protein